MKLEYNLDVLKPHQPSSEHLARSLKGITGVSLVRIKVDEIDQKTTSVYIRIRGNESTSLEAISKCLDENNCSLHSVDEVLISDKE